MSAAAFLGLAKARAKLGAAFWDYLGSRLRIALHPDVPPLPDLTAAQASQRSCRCPEFAPLYYRLDGTAPPRML